MGKQKYNKTKEVEKQGSIETTTTIITKSDVLDEMLNMQETVKEKTNEVVPEQMVVMPKQREVIGAITSTEVLVIDRINGFTYVKEGNLRKQYNSIQYKVDNPYNPTTATVSADGIDIGVLAIEFIGKEKHQLSDIELDEAEEERIKKESFVVKS